MSTRLKQHPSALLAPQREKRLGRNPRTGDIVFVQAAPNKTTLSSKPTRGHGRFILAQHLAASGTMVLNNEDRDRVLHALENPPAPTAQLVSAFRKFAQR